MLMAEGRQKAEWGRTAATMALIANCHRDPKKKSTPFTADDYLPRSRSRGQHVSVARLTDEILRVAEARGVTSPKRDQPLSP